MSSKQDPIEEFFKKRPDLRDRVLDESLILEMIVRQRTELRNNGSIRDRAAFLNTFLYYLMLYVKIVHPELYVAPYV